MLVRRRPLLALLVLGSLAAPVVEAVERPRPKRKPPAVRPAAPADRPAPKAVPSGPGTATLAFQVASVDGTARVVEGTFDLTLAGGTHPAPEGEAYSGRWQARLGETVPALFVARPVLQIIVVPEGSVEIDGRGIGRVSVTQVAVTEGRHVIRVTHPDYLPLQRSVSFLPGQTQRLVIDMAEEAVPRRD